MTEVSNHTSLNVKEVSLPLEFTKKLIHFEPYEGKQSFLLNFSLKEFQGICISFNGTEEAYPSPSYINQIEQVPDHTQLILIKDQDLYYSFFSLSYDGQTAAFSGHSQGLEIHLTSLAKCKNSRFAFVSIQGGNIYHVLEETLTTALKATGGLGKKSDEKKHFIPWITKVGWYSASYKEPLDHKAIIDYLKTLVDKGHAPAFILLDSYWQGIHDPDADGSMNKFQASPKYFPFGLKAFYDDLVNIGIHHLGVEHPFLDVKEGKGSKANLGQNLGQTFEFFNEYYAYLKKQGVSFVKVTHQNRILANDVDLTLLSKNLQSSIQAAASIQFNSLHFNSQCLSNFNLYYWSRADYANLAAKSSLEQIPELNLFIRNCLMNALWVQTLMIPDLDAWVSPSCNDEILAIFYALSGSPILLESIVDPHVFQQLRKMLLPSGVLIQADRPLTVCEESVFIDPCLDKHVYKAFTYKGNQGILGIFNLTNGNRLIHGQVSANHIKNIAGERFAVFSHHNGFLGVVNSKESLNVTLKPHQGDVITFVPIQNGVGVLGCYPFFIAKGPLFEINLDPESLHLSSYVAGPILIYSERQVLEVRRNGLTIPWEYDERRNILSIDSRAQIQDITSNYCITFEF